MVCFVHVVACVNKKTPWGPPSCEHLRSASRSILRFLKVAKLRLDVNLFITPFAYWSDPQLHLDFYLAEGGKGGREHLK